MYTWVQRYYDFASKHGFPQKINYNKKCSVLLLFRIVGDALEMFILMGRCELLFLYVLVTFALCRGMHIPFWYVRQACSYRFVCIWTTYNDLTAMSITTSQRCHNRWWSFSGNTLACELRFSRHVLCFTYTHTHIYIHYIYIYIHVQTYIHTYIHTYVRTYIHTYIRVYIYIHIYLHIYIYIHTYVYT